MLTIALSIIIGYIFGSIPSGLVLVKMVCGIDIREYGSKNIGTTNVFRTVGGRMASIVLVSDVVKGILAVLLVRYLFDSNLHLELFTAIAALLGHNYSMFLGFKGGRDWSWLNSLIYAGCLYFLFYGMAGYCFCHKVCFSWLNSWCFYNTYCCLLSRLSTRISIICHGCMCFCHCASL